MVVFQDYEPTFHSFCSNCCNCVTTPLSQTPLQFGQGYPWCYFYDCVKVFATLSYMRERQRYNIKATSKVSISSKLPAHCDKLLQCFPVETFSVLQSSVYQLKQLLRLHSVGFHKLLMILMATSGSPPTSVHTALNRNYRALLSSIIVCHLQSIGGPTPTQALPYMSFF